MMYCCGLVFMMGADGQKYFILREKRKLLNDGFMKWSRNPNYVGEMMIYGSFALVVQRYEFWFVLAYMWGLVFTSRMVQKDYSLSKKLGWEEYASHSWMWAFKFGGSAILSAVIYGVFIGVTVYCYNHGGIEATVKMLTK